MNQQDQEVTLCAEARYRRERLDLCRARVYSGRTASPERFRELQRAYDGAASRLRRFEEGAEDMA